MTRQNWHVTRLHHVAFAYEDPAVPDILGDVLGLRCAHEIPADGFVERMLPAGSSYVQLLEATGPGVVEQFVQRRGPGLHHVAFEVTDIEEAVSDLQARGVRLVDQIPRPGGMGTLIAFIHPHSCGGMLVELVAARPADTAGGSTTTPPGIVGDSTNRPADSIAGGSTERSGL